MLLLYRPILYNTELQNPFLSNRRINELIYYIYVTLTLLWFIMNSSFLRLISVLQM